MYIRKLLILATATALFACGPSENNGSNNDTNGDTNNAPTNNDTNNSTTDTNNASNNDTNNGTDTDTNNSTGSNNQTNNVTTPTNNGTGGPPDFLALAVTADFDGGSSAWHAVSNADGELSATTNDFGAGDVSVAVGDQWAYVLDRTSSQVQVLNRDDLSEAELLDVTGAVATNPQSATDVGGKIYVSLYGVPEILVATLDGQEVGVERLDTSAFDTADDNPEASAMLRDEDYVLVVLQRLENFMGVDNSALLVIDTTDDSFVDFDDATAGVQPLDLGVKNAQANMRWTPDGNIAIGATGAYGANDGGIVIVERNAAGDYTVGDTIVTEEDLGGDLLDFVLHDASTGLAVITFPDFGSELVHFEEGTFRTIDVVESPGFSGLDLMRDPSWWVAGDRGDEQGFNLVQWVDDAGAFLPTDLPPSGFVFVDGSE